MTQSQITAMLTASIRNKLNLPADTPMSAIVLDESEPTDESADEFTSDPGPRTVMIDMRPHFEAQEALKAKERSGHQVVDAALPADLRMARSRPTATIEDSRLVA